MPEPTVPERNREQFWRTFIVPTAQGLEGFFWRIAWFAVLIKILFFS